MEFPGVILRREDGDRGDQCWHCQGHRPSDKPLLATTKRTSSKRNDWVRFQVSTVPSPHMAPLEALCPKPSGKSTTQARSRDYRQHHITDSGAGLHEPDVWLYHLRLHLGGIYVTSVCLSCLI